MFGQGDNANRIGIVDLAEEDIASIMDYWFNPDNLDFHKSRSVSFNEQSMKELESYDEYLRGQIAMAPQNRSSTTVIVTMDGRKIGHVLLNNIHDPEKQRMHFHPAWPPSDAEFKVDF